MEKRKNFGQGSYKKRSTYTGTTKRNADETRHDPDKKPGRKTGINKSKPFNPGKHGRTSEKSGDQKKFSGYGKTAERNKNNFKSPDRFKTKKDFSASEFPNP